MWDNLHPNANGYSKMANLWYSALKLLLPAPSPQAPVITSSPVTIINNGQYIHDVKASGIGSPSYFLTTKPSGMTINENTGLINRIPSALR